MGPSDQPLGTPTGIVVKHEESFHMNEQPNGDWVVEIHNNITGSASMIIRQDHMRHIRDVLNKSVKGDVGGDS